MTLRIDMRALRAPVAMLACGALAVSPAVAAAAHRSKRPPRRTAAAFKGLGASAQIAAMNTAISAAPGFYPGLTSGCASVTPVLASTPGTQVMAGNFRDAQGGCYVWLNLSQTQALTAPEICKTTLHEMGHLNGLQHSSDPSDVMFSPFISDPIPAPCQAQPAR
jgi:uncharacterized membrane protein YoaK (UPF0700 family)